MAKENKKSEDTRIVSVPVLEMIADFLKLSNTTLGNNLLATLLQDVKKLN